MKRDLKEFSPVAHFLKSQADDIPEFSIIDPEEVPAPLHDLLVHNGDMTSRLEAHHQSSIHLKLLNYDKTENTIFREVQLQIIDNNKTVEYGIIEINLRPFPAALRDEILEGTKPLGGLLNLYKFDYTSSPQAFFSVLANTKISHILDVEISTTLYGRSNILTSAEHTLANIIEILPPA